MTTRTRHATSVTYKKKVSSSKPIGINCAPGHNNLERGATFGIKTGENYFFFLPFFLPFFLFFFLPFPLAMSLSPFLR
ncbi:MAG: hypothetical protein DRI77_00160 [Chloroflexi bacterium]|nr:MAG: hypothetical protein DRI77_00160 [Chloroflexota bacterium]